MTYCRRRWPRALNRQIDFGAQRDWFVKDSLLFTPPPPQTSATNYEIPTLTNCLPYMRDTGFGCKEIVSLRINGEFTFPGAAECQPQPPGQFAESFDHHLKLSGPRNARSPPILELGVYGVLLFLKKLQRVKMPALPTVIARLSRLVGEDARLSLQSLTFGDRDLLSPSDVAGIARLCGDALAEVVNFSPDSIAPSGGDADNIFVSHNGSGVVADRNFSTTACRAATHLAGVRSFSGRMSFSCFVHFARVGGERLARIHLSSAAVFDLADILLLRKFAPNLEAIEGSYNIRTDEESFFPTRHRHETTDSIQTDGWMEFEAGMGPFSPELKKLLAECPMRALRTVDVEGRLTLMAMQLFAGNAERLEQLHVANSTPAMRETTESRVILSDEWIDGLIHVGALRSSLRRLTLRTSRVESADAGAFSEAGLLRLLDYCAARCPRVGEVVGEFTRVPDRRLAAVVERYAVEEGLRGLSVRNAVPYRRFDNDYDSERYYSMNEGYRELLRRQQEEVALAAGAMAAGGGEQEPQQQHANSWWRRGNTGGAGAGGAGRRCLRWEGYVFRPFEK